MNITNNLYNTNYKGYDVMPLRGIYMQGWETCAGQKITHEMSAIAAKEKIPFYINNYGKIVKETLGRLPFLYDSFCIWAQDTKNFIIKNGAKQLLCNAREAIIKKENLEELNDYDISVRKHLPRGGNFYIGYKPNGEKWILVSAKTTMGDTRSMYKSEYEDNKILKGLFCPAELVKLSEISSIFDIEMKNIHLLNTSYEDLDMLIRPMGYPYVLVNDYDETIKNIEKMQEKFPDSEKKYNLSKESEKYKHISEELFNSLKEQGFTPIKIGGAYATSINFLNAIAFRTEQNGISYITNSMRGSSPELEYLEKLFEDDLRTKINGIENVYFVSGGKAKDCISSIKDDCINEIMFWLGRKNGGIHCMTAEIPDFDKMA